MATLEKIRSKSGLLVTVIGVALFAFIIGDLFTGGETFMRQAQDKVVTINGVKVTTGQFSKSLNEFTEVVKMHQGAASLPAESQEWVNRQVYDNIVNEALLYQEAEKLGLSITKAELVDMVSGDHISPVVEQIPFFRNQETGAFQKEALVNFLSNVVNADAATASMNPQIAQMQSYWMFWEKSVKQNRLQEKYNALLSKAIQPNKLDIQSQYDASKTSVDFAYAKKDLSSVPDSAVAVSSSEIKALYDKVKDSRYKSTEGRGIKYFVVDIKPSQSDFAAVSEEINNAKSEFSTTDNLVDFVNLNSEVPFMDAFVPVASLSSELQTFANNSPVGEVLNPALEDNFYRMYRLVGKTTAPDSVKVSHIMLAIGQDEKAADKLADSLMTVLNSPKADFAALAAQFSQQPQTAANGGELGWFTESSASANAGADIKNALFSANGSKPFINKGNGVINIFKVTERTKPVAKAKIAEYALSVTPSSRTTQKLYSDITGFVATNNSLDKLVSAAPEAGYNVLSNSNLQNTSYNIGQVRNARHAVRWAFENKPGSISEVFEIDNKFLVVAVESENAAGYTPLAQVENSLKRELASEKKAAKIIAELSKYSTVGEYASAMNSNVDTAKFVTFNTSNISGIGVEPAITGVAPYAALNALNGPVAGKRAVYVYAVTDKKESEAAFNEESEKQSWNNAMMYRLTSEAMRTLVNNSNIEDNRIRFY